MSSRNDTQRLQDMLDAIAMIERDVYGFDEAQFIRDGKTCRSVLYSFSVIGEAAANLSQVTQAKSPSIPWIEIKGMRNYIIHEYFRVNLDVVWEAISNDLPRLKQAIESILDR